MGPRAKSDRASNPCQVARARPRKCERGRSHDNLPFCLPAGLHHRLVGPGQALDTVGLDTVLRDESAAIVDDAVLAALRRDVEAELHGAGPLEPLLALPGVTDVLVNGPRDVWLDCGQGMQRAAVTFADEAAVRRLAQRLSPCGVRPARRCAALRRRGPCGRHAGARGAAAAAEHTTFSLRVLARRPYRLERSSRAARCSERLADVLRAMVAARLAFVISGGTGTGKTTLLGALLGAVPVTATDRGDRGRAGARRRPPARGAARAARGERRAAGAVGQRELVRQALRMRPDRLVVGEFRGAEMVELLVALNTGHEGGAATCTRTLRLTCPPAAWRWVRSAGLPAAAVTSLVASAVDVVVHLRRGRDGRRVVAESACSTTPR